ncbi:serine/threonine protein kinase [Coemansia sp. RSA 1646]|nr:serine/threonine protein kinase [Coemansia sp. RSA 1646]
MRWDCIAIAIAIAIFDKIYPDGGIRYSQVVAIKTLQNKARSTTSTREPDNSGSRSPESSNSSILSRRVLEELGIAVNMRHRNIISTHEVIVETGQTCYVVMEACSVDLLTLIQGRQQKLPNGCILPSNKAAMDGYFVQLVQGVHYLHSIGVGHRDLKLDNICITEKGVLKIVDFGCATLFRRRIQHQLVPKSSSSHASARLARERAAPYSVPNPQQIQAVRTGGSHGHQYVETLSYGMCGSDPYMAPELFGSGYYMAPRVDIWALGIIYFAMQHQQFPWAVAQASRDTRYKAFEKAPEAFVETWFSETPTDDATIGRKGEEGFFESLGSWSLVPSSPGVNFLNMTQKKCHPDDSHVFQTTAEVSGRMSVRRIVRRMLDINPASRADINELVSDPWFKAMCQQSEKQL